jgi:putative cardiolipin synthase
MDRQARCVLLQPWNVAGSVGLISAFLLGGCATLPPPEGHERSYAVAATADTQLGAMAARMQPFEQATGSHLLVSGVEAYEARLQLIERAQATIDVQYYHFALDATGISLAEALVRAARRGVRVRFLVDDYYTAGQDDALLALSSEPGVGVRIYNPFVGARETTVLRWISSLWDIQRVNARMHNKLLVVDGAMAVMGGRNIADAYFQRGEGHAFLDLDLLLVGSVLPELQLIFDLYWNSEVVYPIESIARARPPADAVSGGQAPAFAAGPDTADSAVAQARSAFQPRIREQFESQNLRFHWGWAQAYADSPTKWRGTGRLLGRRHALAEASHMRQLVWNEMAQARSEYLILTPYLIPGDGGMRAVRENRSRGVRIGVVTNSLASTDEPAVHGGYQRYRRLLLEEGVDLWELAPTRATTVLRWKTDHVFGLHVKSVVFDRDTVFIGSLNFDPRSEAINTETGIIARSQELAEEILDIVDVAKRKAFYRMRLDANGGLLWDASSWQDDPHTLTCEPNTNWWERAKVRILSPFIPEWML